MARLLDELGVYGMSDPDEVAIIATFLTGDPILLIGEPGSAKTALGKVLGSAFREYDKREGVEKPFTTQAYDCSKLNFEDIMGFPNPKLLQEGKIGFVNSPMTAWGKNLIIFDEFNRQDPSRQGNILELVRSRTLQGIKTGTEYVIACMNPFGMEGTEVLSEALVDRMAFYIYVKGFLDLDDEVAMDCIVHHTGEDDGPALRKWLDKSFEFDTKEEGINETLADAGAILNRVLTNAAKHYKEIEEAVGESYGTFIAVYFTSLHEELASKAKASKKGSKLALSGRRASMAKRCLISYRAVDIALSEEFTRRPLTDLKTSFINVMRRCLPVGISTASARGADAEMVNSITSNLERYSQFFQADSPSTAIAALDVVHELLATRSIERKIQILIHEITDDVVRNSAWKDIIADSMNEPDNSRISLLICVVSNLMTLNPSIIPENMRNMLANQYSQVLTKLEDYGGSLEVTGSAAFHADIIRDSIADYENPFLKLQAKIMWEDFLDAKVKSRVLEADVRGHLKEVSAECIGLSGLLKRENIMPEEKNVKTVDDVHKEIDSTWTADTDSGVPF